MDLYDQLFVKVPEDYNMTVTFTSPVPESVEIDNIDFNVVQTTFEDKKVQFALKSATPQQQWRLKFGLLTNEELEQLYQFYIARNGRYEMFYWYHPYMYTFLSETEPGAETVLAVPNTINALVGDYIRIAEEDTEIDTVASVIANTSITLDNGLDSERTAGSRVEVRYPVRFAEQLEWNTLKMWARQVEILLERDLG